MKCTEWKTGFSSCFYSRSFSDADQHGEKAMSLMMKGGVTCMEMSASLEGYMKVDFFAHPEKIAEAAQKTGMELWSIHLPFSQALDISTNDPVNRENTIRIHIAAIKSAKKAGFKVIVVHPSSEPISDEERPSRKEWSIKGLTILKDLCDELGLQLAVEDLPRTCLCHTAKEMKEILDAVPGLKVVFDTNHILEMNHDDNLNFIRTVGDRIITLHVSDYDFIDERHKLPGDGKNDWTAIIRALEEAGYNGPFLYELGEKATDRPQYLPITPEILREVHLSLANAADK